MTHPIDMAKKMYGKPSPTEAKPVDPHTIQRTKTTPQQKQGTGKQVKPQATYLTGATSK
jgi:hypothetical protein